MTSPFDHAWALLKGWPHTLPYTGEGGPKPGTLSQGYGPEYYKLLEQLKTGELGAMPTEDKLTPHLTELQRDATAAADSGHWSQMNIPPPETRDGPRKRFIRDTERRRRRKSDYLQEGIDEVEAELRGEPLPRGVPPSPKHELEEDLEHLQNEKLDVPWEIANRENERALQKPLPTSPFDIPY